MEIIQEWEAPQRGWDQSRACYSMQYIVHEPRSPLFPILSSFHNIVIRNLLKYPWASRNTGFLPFLFFSFFSLAIGFSLANPYETFMHNSFQCSDSKAADTSVAWITKKMVGTQDSIQKYSSFIKKACTATCFFNNGRLFLDAIPSADHFSCNPYANPYILCDVCTLPQTLCTPKISQDSTTPMFCLIPLWILRPQWLAQW